MRPHRVWFLILAVSVTLAQVNGPASARQDAGIERLVWLSGCWRLQQGASVTDEQWMAPAGGVMLAISRTVRDGRVVATERLRIGIHEGVLTYTAEPSGQSLTHFPLKSLSDGLVVFEAPDHDFPQRIIYRRVSADSMVARIEGERDGVLRGVDFPFRRIRCGPAGTSAPLIP